MKNTEELIWNRITNSAKTRFDYTSFADKFNEIDENIAENILFKIIVGFAVKKTKTELSHELFNDVLLIGYKWDLKEIHDFINDIEELLKLEFYVSWPLKLSSELGQNQKLATVGFKVSSVCFQMKSAKGGVAKKQQMWLVKVDKGKNVLLHALTLWHNSSNFSIGGVVWARWWSQNSN